MESLSDLLTEEQKQIIKYSNSCELFIKEILGLKCEWFHKEWIDLIESNKYVSLLAPRSHGKTTLLGAYLTWRIIKNPNIRVLIVTINQQRANEMMGLIQQWLKTNEKLISIFGEQVGSEWSMSTLRVKRVGKTGIAHKEPTLTVFGLTAGMVGGHYDVVVLDDITDRENSRLQHRRRELERWYNMTVTPMLLPEGQIISIGTLWHEDDIHNYFRKKLENYTCKNYRAILNEDEIKSGGKPQVLWSEEWPYEKLMNRKSGMGSVAFQMQYQNDIVSTEDSPIKREWVESSMDSYGRILNDLKKGGGSLQTFMGVDLASKGEESDYFTISIIGIHEGKIFVLDGLRTKASLFKQFEYIRSYDSKWTPGRIGIEQAAQQKMIVDQLIESTTLPIIPIKSSIVNDRMSRVQRLSVLFETGRIYLSPKLQLWADEMIVFPRGANDDTLDSLSFAIQASQFKEEEESKIDWSLAADMVSSKKTDNVSHVGNRFSFTKI